MRDLLYKSKNDNIKRIMRLNKSVATLYIMNPNCKEPSFPAYDYIDLSLKKYPITNLNNQYVKNLIQELYPKDYEEEYFAFTIFLTGEIIKDKGVMPNPMTTIEHIVAEKIQYIP